MYSIVQRPMIYFQITFTQPALVLFRSRNENKTSYCSLFPNHCFTH